MAFQLALVTSKSLMWSDRQLYDCVCP